MKRYKELLGQFQIKPLKIVKFNGVKNVYRSNGDAEHNQINILNGQNTFGVNSIGSVGGNVGAITGANSGYIGDSGTFTNSAYATKTARTDAIEPNNDTFGTTLTVIDDEGMVRKVHSRLYSGCYYIKLMRCE